MAVYEYRGLDQAGRDIKGIIDADSPRLARTKLRRSGIFPTEILTDRHTKKSVIEGVSIGTLFGRISIQEISIMTRQMATLVGAGLPIVEAMACEMPVISTSVGGPKEVIKKGKKQMKRDVGILIPPKDPKSIAEAVSHLYKDKEESVSMGKAAREYVIRNYSWEKNAKKVLEVYDFAMNLVTTIEKQADQTGEYDVPWDGRNEEGDIVANGVYFFKIESPGQTQWGKVVVIK